ncbi:MAG: SiaB family protein kinase [Desulfomonilaceae bacterium]
MRFNLQDLYLELKQNSIIFCFCGPISQEVIEGVGGTLRQKMKLEEVDLNTTQKVFAVFVEQMQNIVNYSADRLIPEDRQEGEIRIGVLIVGQENTGFYVLCGNKIRKEETQNLRKQLDMINRMNKDELKQLYLERRKMAPMADKKGAGLGLIDIARKSTRPIEFDFSPVDGDFVFFSVKAVI